MHLEILVEDKSGSIVVENVIKKVIENYNMELSFRLHTYKGLGKLPDNLRTEDDPEKRVLLEQLPRILRGYGKSLVGYGAVMVVVDCDKRDCKAYKDELKEILQKCDPAPTTVFCIAIEEIEAWLLGDREALIVAYPEAKISAIDAYIQDSICDTWELLADVLYSEKAIGLKKRGYPEIGLKKCEWAERITPNITIERNNSQSFQYFVKKVKELAYMA